MLGGGLFLFSLVELSYRLFVDGSLLSSLLLVVGFDKGERGASSTLVYSSRTASISVIVSDFLCLRQSRWVFLLSRLIFVWVSAIFFSVFFFLFRCSLYFLFVCLSCWYLSEGLFTLLLWSLGEVYFHFRRNFPNICVCFQVAVGGCCKVFLKKKAGIYSMICTVFLKKKADIYSMVCTVFLKKS